MKGLNKIMLIGRLGADPEARQTPNGKCVTKFSIATASGKGDNEKTDWHKIITFGQTAENCARYLAKGRLCFIEGRVSYKSYERADQRVYFTEIIANRVNFLSPASKDEKVSIPPVDEVLSISLLDDPFPS